MNIKLMHAKREAYRAAPYAANAILTLSPAVEKPGLGTFSVDQYWRMYYDPEIVEQSSPQELSWLVLHEVLHLVMRHFQRAERIVSGDEWETWNIAADLAIWSVLNDLGVNNFAPAGAHKPEEHGLEYGLTAEEYYFALLKKRDKKDHDGERSGNSERSTGESGDSQGDAGGSGQAPDNNNGLGGDGSSASDGRERDWEIGEPTSDGDGLNHYESDRLLRKTARIMEEYEKSKGDLPGGLKRCVEEILHPRLDPRELLHFIVSNQIDEIRAAQCEGVRSYRRPSRRPNPFGLIKPRQHEFVPRILIVCDVSGSMTKHEVALSLGLVASCIDTFRNSDGIRVVVGDAAKHTDQQVFDASKVELVGDGGTDMAQVIESALVDDDRPDLVICCTDGETGWPTEDTMSGIPLVACLTSPSYTRVPAWIHQVNLSAA